VRHRQPQMMKNQPKIIHDILLVLIHRSLEGLAVRLPRAGLRSLMAGGGRPRPGQEKRSACRRPAQNMIA
jgi:hypothetical protein